MPRLFAVGYRGDGQMGEDTSDDDSMCVAVPFEVTVPSNVCMVSCGVKHTLILDDDGVVYSVGSNECGQLGRLPTTDESFTIAPINLSGKTIIQIASGLYHNAAVTNDGRLFLWGANHVSQCGVEPCPKITRPQRLSMLTEVIQVACGENTTITLTTSCSVYVFGLFNDSHLMPTQVELLSLYPVVQVAAGACHFAALTAGGQVFCFGNNSNGQTAGNVSDRFTLDPSPVSSLTKVVYVACGAKHTVVLTLEGRVLAFGNNSQGQIGDGRKCDVVGMPKGVIDLLGYTVSSIACGSRYTMAVTNGSVYAFGLNNTGQLGVGDFKNQYSPKLVRNMSNVAAVFCGAEHTFFLVDDMSDLPTLPLPIEHRVRIPKFLNFKETRRLIDAGIKMDIIAEIESVFSSVGCINGSFLYEDDRKYILGDACIGVDLDNVMYAMGLIESSSHAPQYIELIENNLELCEIFQIGDRLAVTDEPLNHELARFFFVLPWVPSMSSLPKKSFFETFLSRYIDLLQKIINRMEKQFETWWKALPTRHFNRFTRFLMNVLEYQFNLHHDNPPVFRSLLDVIKKLAAVNRITGVIPYDHFYLNSLEDKVNLKMDFIQSFLYRHPEMRADIDVPKVPNAFFWFDYPFLMNVAAKTNVLECYSKIAQHTRIQEDSIFAFGFFNLGSMMPFCSIEVDRNNIVHDTIGALHNMDRRELKKPLRVAFRGEDGEDEGGVRKEFFMLLFPELLQMKYGMFNEDPDSHYIWFSDIPIESYQYYIVGILCSMAIYNAILVALPFPLGLYKYLTGLPLTFQDLQDLHPVEARSLEQLLEYEGDDIADVFMLNFVMNINILGHSEEVELKSGGAEIPVTQENKREFVDLYVQRRLVIGQNGQLKNQLDDFKKGFEFLFGPELLSVFQAKELMELMSGNENYDWDELRENCKYKDGYYKDHPAIKAFWEAFFELEEEEKKKFLLFLMGTTRIPWKGMSKVSMFIQPTDPAKIPAAHTCFNLLDLPNITDKQELLRRLRICIENNQGFNLA